MNRLPIIIALLIICAIPAQAAILVKFDNTTTSNSASINTSAGNIFCTVTGGSCNTTNGNILINDPNTNEVFFHANFSTTSITYPVYMQIYFKEDGSTPLWAPFHIANTTTETGTDSCSATYGPSYKPYWNHPDYTHRVSITPGTWDTVGGTGGMGVWLNMTVIYYANATTAVYQNGTLLGSKSSTCSQPTPARSIYMHTGGGQTGSMTISKLCVYDSATGNHTYECFSGASPPPVATATLRNAVNDSAWPTNVTFSNVTGSLTFNYFNITANGFCVTYTGNGTGTNCTTGSGQSTYFNTTTTSTANTSQTISASTHQGYFEVRALQLFTNASISAFNATNAALSNTTTTGLLILKALNGTTSIKIDTPGNYSQNITCTLPAPLQTISCNATGIHDSIFQFNATDTYNNVKINTFSINASNTTLGVSTQNTTNGTTNTPLLQGYNYHIQFLTPGGIYEYANVTLPANASLHRYTFNVLPAPSVDVTIRNAATDALITANLTIRLTSNTTDTTITTTSGGYFFQNLTPGNYTLRVSGGNYTESTYQVSATSGAVYFLTAYLQQNTGSAIFQFVDSIASSMVISGVSVSQERQVNGSWQVITTKTTDITGRASFDYLSSLEYRFIAIKGGYVTKEFTLNPILYDSYQIKMARSTTLNFSEDFQSVYIDYEPKIFYDGRENAINLTFSSPSGKFTAYNYTIKYPGGSKTGTGNNLAGESFNIPFNITNSTFNSRVNITLTYETMIGQAHDFQYSHLILITPGNTTFVANQGNTYGLGLIERLLIGTGIIIVIAGLATLAAGPIAGLVVALLLMGWAVKIGFWPWWAAGLSFLVGLALIARRTE